MFKINFAFLVHFLVLQVLEEDGVQEAAGRVGGVFMDELLRLRDEFPCVGDVRGKGLMLGVEMVADEVSTFGDL